MGLCDKLTAGIASNCNRLVSGVNQKLVLANREDISFTRDSTNPQLITGVSLIGGATGFLFEGRRNSVTPSSAMQSTKYDVGFIHTVGFVIFDNNAAVKKIIAQLASGDVVAFIENNYKGVAGNASFEIFGTDAGLVLKTVGSDKYNADTQGAYELSLSTPDGSFEPYLPSSLFVTDYAASKVIFNSLFAA